MRVPAVPYRSPITTKNSAVTKTRSALHEPCGFLHLVAAELPHGIKILTTGWYFSEVQGYDSARLPIKTPHTAKKMQTMKSLTSLVALTLVLLGARTQRKSTSAPQAAST
jgi:hypothetical protein